MIVCNVSHVMCLEHTSMASRRYQYGYGLLAQATVSSLPVSPSLMCSEVSSQQFTLSKKNLELLDLKPLVNIYMYGKAMSHGKH